MASMAPPRPEPAPVRPARTGPPGWIGLLLALPMFAGTIWWLAVPTVQTIVQAFTGKAPMIAGDGRVYASHRPGSFTGTGDALGRTLVLALLPTLVMLVVVPLLSFAAAEAGSPLRKAVRVVLTVPVAGFAPAVAVSAYAGLVMPADGALSFLRPFDAGTALPKLSVIAGLSVLGLVAGIGVSALLSALRRRTGEAPRGRIGAGLAVWGVLVLGTLAVAMQAITMIIGLTGGGPGVKTTTLGILSYNNAFRYFAFGAGASAGTVLLVPVMLLGVAATLILILSRARIELTPRDTAPAPSLNRGRAVGLGVVALVGSLLLVAVELVPRLGLLGGHPARTPDTATETLLYTLLPAVLTTIVQVVLAYPAGIGIGAFRPLGAHSRWLLLPFAPWLFVTVTPLMTTYWQSARAADTLDTGLGAMSPILVSIPAMVVFALFGSGHAQRWRDRIAGGFARTVLLPSLPLVALVGTAILLVEAHSMLWRLLVLTGRRTASTLLLQLLGQYVSQSPSIGLLLSAAPLAIPALVALIALQLVYVDRLAIRLGDPAPAGAGSAGGTGVPAGPQQGTGQFPGQSQFPGQPGAAYPGQPGAGGQPGAAFPGQPGAEFSGPSGAAYPGQPSGGQPASPGQQGVTAFPGQAGNGPSGGVAGQQAPWQSPGGQTPATPPAQAPGAPQAPWAQPGPNWGAPPPAPGVPGAGGTAGPGGPHLGGLPPGGAPGGTGWPGAPGGPVPGFAGGPGAPPPGASGTPQPGAPGTTTTGGRAQQAPGAPDPQADGETGRPPAHG
ncbi:hypothetical protein GCM10022220_29240 [Actinocatenispora rupis]|uniref:ABC-type sugar transport system, permease component n=2 Tax=Actinocatenispora rupis TaxID=519421 RepID=A0A8J3J213_9ACTN|nr:hypothetical protein Aru02nite_39840 [Actinocatenispora rupis]